MSTAPQYCPTPRELDDLELLVSGALAPLAGFDEPGSPITLTLPDDVQAAATEAGAVELVDPEGLPLARVSIPGGQVEALTHAQYGPFRRYYLTPAQAREQHAGRTWVAVTDALTEEQVATLAGHGPVALVALVGAGTPDLSAVALIKATLLAAAQLPDAVVVAVPLAARESGDAETDHALGLAVLATYAGGDTVIGLPEAGEDDSYADDVAAVVAHDQPAPSEQGLVLFFTGLSGSGKSTLARALMDKILEQGTRTITSLDGDVVRRNLSKGLTFSKEDRETNIRRIGWVAAEIARHHGLAIVSPIAPFDSTRQDVRGMVEDAGGAFFLVHVATPLEECERRDRKGLYAKARAGEIPEFTGISSPYEVPTDADVVVDTTGRTIPDALDDVVTALAESGYLDLTTTPLAEEGDSSVVEVRGARATSHETPAPDNDAEPLNVLMVCTANICRSPFMQLLGQHLAGDDLVIRSAGTMGFDASEMDETMASTLVARGVSEQAIADFRSQPVTRQLVEQADLVLTAEARHRQVILDENPAAFRKVFSLGQFVQAAEASSGLTGAELLAAVATKRGAASADLDVADPYRRGPEAAEQAAQLIEGWLRTAVGSLTGKADA
ncbi:adenylyl-sulfate kinase [Nocardioides bruguierae]|uniref:adenylyl-sulfate kinase n=1 Tax=Nocardioides bruguierae TaxID=2945102 RepID=UPI002022742F|nr:adenylyl-sulfate kinase [Nocardioides bruguierae]MCL8026263.1 adenylyl-sulfate kinase [Nocardioides bruguierae]